ncbi:uncharacterized protein HGUI_02681 [Hanseniaspora guilliermondii]|uniref:SWIRM domain-containing protein n=1 Tax=Hanseniaspora guilliermondii TaxID=56406 RepID=A0A1L0CPU6_9ASCO|nr:uncharacterized protein HGUI_02681 [Hanseniaspora guilliermondii]
MIDDNLINEHNASDDILNQDFDFNNLTSNPSNILSNENLNMPEITDLHNDNDLLNNNNDDANKITIDSSLDKEKEPVNTNDEAVAEPMDVSNNLNEVNDDTTEKSGNNAEIIQEEAVSDSDKMNIVKPEKNDANNKEEEILKDSENVNKTPTENTAKVIHEPKLYPQMHSILIPSYSYWFDLDKINQKEKEELPEFFIEDSSDDISKTAQYYKTVRNFIVNTYRINPSEKISFFAIRRNLKGDAGSLLRIFKFLEKWGLINHQVNFTNEIESLNEVNQVDASTNEQVSQILGKLPNLESTRHFGTSSDSSKKLYPFKSYKPSVSVQDLEYLKKIIGEGNDHDNDGARDIDKTVELLLQKRKLEASEENLNKDSKRQRRSLKWTDKEYKKLLELFYKYSEGGTAPLQSLHWIKISQEVNLISEENVLKTEKTPTDCILKFLQIPIEDDYLMKREDLGIFKYAPYLNGLGIEGSAGNSSQIANPVLETLTTLIGYVEPEKLKKILEFINEEQKIENIKQSDLDIDNPGNESAFKNLVNLGFASLAIRADKMALNEYSQTIKQMKILLEHSIKKVNLKMEKLKILEKVRFQEIEKTKKERIEHKLNLLRIKKGVDVLEQKYSDNKELFDDLRALINEKYTFEKKGEHQGDNEADKTSKETDDLPVSITDNSKYRYWSP